MGRAIGFRLSKGARLTLGALDQVLDGAYGAPEADLDNKRDPLDEAVYIILSFQTDLDRFRRVWAELRLSFPSWENLAQAPLRRVARVLREGGLQEQKARTIKRLFRAINSQTGRFSLDLLREMDDAEAERFLTRLPGLSWKAARCVLLYSLDRAVLPVDGNTFRVLKRVGVLPANAVYRRRSLHDGLQVAVAPSRRRPFHVNLVVHGQRTCLPRRPLCCDCVVRPICAMKGVSLDVKAQARRVCQTGPEKAVAWRKRATA